jgi:hypothetical protein
VLNPLKFILVGILISLLLGAYYIGNTVASNACRADRATEQRKRAVAHSRELLNQINRADRVAITASVRDAAYAVKLQEIQREIKDATTGRACFGGAALRVLDHATGLKPPPAGLPQDRSAPAAADSAGEDVATDTDVADWIVKAGTLYEQCRSRIRDIRCIDDGGCE